MATKKSEAGPKAPKRRKSASAEVSDAAPTDAGERAVARIHDQGAVLTDTPGGSFPEPTPQSMMRGEPDAAAADAAAAEEDGSHLASAVQRALRFADPEAFLLLAPDHITSASSQGTVIVPWGATQAGLPAAGIVVDGRKLHRCLRAAGPAATLRILSAHLEVRFGTRRFSIAIVPGAELNILRPPIDGVTYSMLKPSVFRMAAAFAGDDKIEPRSLAGVHISKGGCLACDRRGLIDVFNATDNTGLSLTLASNALDGFSVGPDGAEDIYIGVSERGHAVLADPRTGEWRVLMGYGSEFPDVRGVLSRWDASTHIDVDKAAFVSALKQLRIVQSAGSSVKMMAWEGAPNTEGAGQWLELKGGDPGSTCEFVARLGCRIHRSTPVGVPGYDTGMVKLCVAMDELLKLASAFPAAHVRIGFGAGERDPLVVKTHLFSAGVMPMVDR